MTAGDDNFLEALRGSLSVVLLPLLPVDFTHMYDLLFLRFLHLQSLPGTREAG